MTRRAYVWLAVLTVGASLCGTGVQARAADKNATGTWKWTFMRPNSDDKIEITMKLKQEGEKLTGTIAGPQGGDAEIKEGTVKNGDVDFKVDRERNGTTVTTHYTGKLDGDAIKGKAESEFNGNKRSRDWEAKRAAD